MKLSKFFHAAFLAWAAAGCLSLGLEQAGSASAPLDQWQWRNPLPNGEVPNAIAYGNGTFAAVGDGWIGFSQDGIYWENRQLRRFYDVGVEAFAAGIAWGNGVWVAVGSAQPPGGLAGAYGVILTSPDSVTWTPSQVPADISMLNGVVYANGLFVAVGYRSEPALQETSGAVLTSVDGVHWASQESGLTGFGLKSIINGNGTFVAVSETGGVILTSNDATNWTAWNSGSWLLYGLTYGQGQYLVSAPGGLLASTDALTWTNRPVSMPGMQLAYGNGLFVAADGSGQIQTSPDGMKWTKRSSGTTQDVRDVAYGNGKFIGVGTGAVVISTNGIVWTNLSSAVTTTVLEDIVYGLGTFVAVGDNGTILKSSDGVSWRPSSSAPSSVHLYKVACGSGTFVATGSQGTILACTNGADWSTVMNLGNTLLEDLTYGNGQFVAISSDGAVVTSTNGTEWEVQGVALPGDSLGLTYGKGIFVVGTVTGVLTSRDALVWEQHDIPALTNVAGAWLSALAYGRGVFVGVGYNGLILTSTNGEDWALAQSGTPAWLHGVTYGNGTFLITGNTGTLLSSTNGTNWVAHDAGTMNPLSAAAFGAGTYVAVGWPGAILQSGLMPFAGPWLTPEPGWTNGGFGLTLTAFLGDQSEIQASTNLVDWVAVTNISSTNTLMQFIDRGAMGLSRRFYRALGK